jgi:hypothetical protein
MLRWIAPLRRARSVGAFRHDRNMGRVCGREKDSSRCVARNSDCFRSSSALV